MVDRKTLWSDVFTLIFTLPNGKKNSEEFQGSVRSAIRYALNRYDTAVVNIYTSNRDWLKEISW